MPITDRRGVVISAGGGAATGAPDTDNAIKAPVRVATTPGGGNITLFGLQSIDGVALAIGDRVLVKDQTDPTQNGIYNVALGAWPRSVDAAAAVNFVQGMLVDVAQGVVNGAALYELVSPAAPIVPGTSALVFQSAADPASIQAIFDGGGNQIALGLKLYAEIPTRMTLKRWTILADAAGTFTVDLWRAPYASLPLSSGNTIIVGGTMPNLGGAQFAQSSNLANWMTGLNAGDVLGFNVMSVAVVQRATLSLWGSRP